MRALTRGVRTILTVTKFFAMVYVTFFCTYLAPTHDLRRWGGAATSWNLIRGGARRRQRRPSGLTKWLSRDHPLIPGDRGSRCWRSGRRTGGFQAEVLPARFHRRTSSC